MKGTGRYFHPLSCTRSCTVTLPHGVGLQKPVWPPFSMKETGLGDEGQQANPTWLRPCRARPGCGALRPNALHWQSSQPDVPARAQPDSPPA
jgi:hypothetical protein